MNNQYAPVANLETYEVLAQYGMLGTYHLMIATEVVKDLKAWSAFWSYPNIHPDDGKDMFIVMDNGLIETGQPADPQTIKDAADAVDANCIVLPDVLGDFGKTIKAVRSSLPELQRLGYPLLGVIQGRDMVEVSAIVEFYGNIGVQYLSIPRVMVEYFGTRGKLVRVVQAMTGGQIPIHLLGFSDNLYDDILSARMTGVMGIDSATPLWHQGILPPTPPVDARFGRRPADYWEWSSNRMNYRNVERVRQWLRADALGVHSEDEPQVHEEQLTLPSA